MLRYTKVHYKEDLTILIGINTMGQLLAAITFHFKRWAIQPATLAKISLQITLRNQATIRTQTIIGFPTIL